METVFVVSKHLHVWCVTLSLMLFVTRLMWKLRGVNKGASSVLLRVLPHAIDTLLLATGFVLVFSAGYLSAFPQWLSIKLGLVLLYIITGIVALKISRKAGLFGALAVGLFFSAAYLSLQK